MDALMIAMVAFGMVAGGLGWWIRRLVRVQIPANRTAFILWMLVGGALGAYALSQGAEWRTYLASGLALAGSAFVLVTAGISGQRVEDAIAVGDTVPTFRAPDENANPVDSATLLGSPTLLKFFRGHW